MNLKRKVAAAAAASVVIGAGLLGTAGESSAETVYEFRLSQFSYVVADMCVHTDIDSMCVYNWGYNVSEFYDVKANSPDNWYCTAHVHTQSDATTSLFSRNDFKECKLTGDPFSGSFLSLVRPDGSTG